MADLTALLTSIDGSAAALGCGRTTIFDLIHEKKLRSVKVGRRRMVVTESLLELVAPLERGEVGA